jgi:transposase InsO family protein
MLPAVSGSSGHLVIAPRAAGKDRCRWPGQVFGEAELSYEEAMQQYVHATQDRQAHQRTPRNPPVEAPARWRQEWEARSERHAVRQRRQQEDADWREAKAHYRAERLASQQLCKGERSQQQGAWPRLQEQRRARRQERKLENQAWHERNRHLKEGALAQPQERSWIAILVVTDNCTRQCLGLPLFRRGAKATSQEVLAALQLLLPSELQFLISDQGAHFRTKWMAQLAEEEDFQHVLVYRHRPESNGIAERFVLTLKGWLRNHSWQSADELEVLLKGFQPEYNDRPHQGLGIPGLSPNEFAHRIWLM